MRYKKYTRFITFCVKPETYEQIDRYCKDLNLSTSEFLRDAVDKYLLDKTSNNDDNIISQDNTNTSINLLEGENELIT